jgi:hypothetical protein
MTTSWRKYLTKSDLIFIVLILVLAIFIFWKQQNRSDLIVRVSYRNEVIGEYLIADPRTITLPDNHGTLEIAKGKARLIQSDCHNHLCEKQGWSASLPIVCAPNMVLVEFFSPKQKVEMIILH